MIAALLLAAALPATSCHEITSDRIYARDLAAAVPLFSALPQDVAMGFAPAPGRQRIFRLAELRRIANANHVSGDIAGDTCFEWRVAAPDPNRMVEAMKKSLAGRDVTLDILDNSRGDVPAGEMEFPLGGIRAVSEAPVVWHGYVTYAPGRRINIWARVRIQVKCNRVVAAAPLRAGEPIRADQIRLEAWEGPLPPHGTLTELADAVGLVTRRPFAEGAPLLRELLDTPREVERGDTVEVSVNSGNTLIKASAIAEESGRRGATIVVRNAGSGKKFRARVEDKGRVSVIPGVFAGLAEKERKS